MRRRDRSQLIGAVADLKRLGSLLVARANALLADDGLGVLSPARVGWCAFEGLGAMRETAFTQALAGVLQSEALGGWVRQRVWEGLVGCVVEAAKEKERRTVNDLLARVPSPQDVAAERTEVLWCPSKLELRPDIVVSDKARYVIFELKLWGVGTRGR